MPLFLPPAPASATPTRDLGALFQGSTQVVEPTNGLAGGGRMRVSGYVHGQESFRGRTSVTRPEVVRAGRINIEARAGNLARPQEHGLPLGTAAYGAGLADAGYGDPSTWALVALGLAAAGVAVLLTARGGSSEG